MKYRRLGESGMKVSVVSLGSWLTFGTTVEKSRVVEIVRTAYDAGVNFYDTADIYGRGLAETCLGEVLKEYRREDLVLASKCFWPMSDGINDRGLSRKHLIEAVHASLSRLKTEYLDLYQCHRYDPETPVAEVVQTMDDLCRQGKILYWGVSCWSADQISEAVRCSEHFRSHPLRSNQPPYNMIDRSIEAEILPVSARLGVGQIVFSPLAQGVLTGKYSGGKIPDGSRASNESINQFLLPRMTPRNLAMVDELREIAQEMDCSLAQLALSWCLRNPEVASVIVGATSPRQMTENVGAASIELPDEILQRIESVLSRKD
ncbi:MAG: aldo/keto reductase family protein [Planctomycetota bacterium]|jgi:voltage-dependent potassium channel beta subunit|nr:aldo/keto reductase family protein [Planctomycetota bacterium]